MDILLLTPRLNLFPQIEKLCLLKVESEFVNLSHGGEHTKMYFLCGQAAVECEEANMRMLQVS